MGRGARAVAILAVVLASTVAAAAPAHLLRVRALGEPATLDWNRASTWIEGFIIRNIMEGLVGIDNHLNAVPMLAERWEVSADHRVYTFHLRSDVKWSDGVPLKAEQFVDSWRRLLAPETNAKYASLLFDLEGAEAFHKGDNKDFSRVGVKALDELTLQVRLRVSVPSWYWVPSFYGTFPVRQDLISARGKDWDKAGAIVSIGPFVLKSHDPQRSVVLERNPHYRGKRGNIDEVDIALVSDDSMALKMYEDGQVDFLPKLASLERNRMRKRKDFHTWPDMRVIHLRLNTAHGPTANASLRRAIALAIDRTKLTKLFEGAFQPAGSLVPPGLSGYSARAGHSFNLERARAELKKSGFDPAKLPPLDLLSPSFDDQVILAQFIQDELKRNLNLNVRIHILEPKRYYSPDLPNADYALQINFWGADFPDSDNFFSVFLSDAGLNRYHWADARYDELVRQARSLPAGGEREKSYVAAQKILIDEQVADIPLYYGRIDGLIRPSISGFDPGALDWTEFKGLSIK